MNSTTDFPEVQLGSEEHALQTLCLLENTRRMARYDVRLLRPRLVPNFAKFLQRILPTRI